jgi:flagella basal body P-ring formation protein FlgA
MKRFLFGLLLCCAPVSLIHAAADHGAVRKAIESWLNSQTQDLPGQVSYEIGNIDRTNQLAPCDNIDVSRPSGAQTWGRTNVLVRCLGEAKWRIYVPVQIHVKAEYLVASRPISQGQVIAEDDLVTQIGDLADLNARTLTDMRLAVGKVAAMAIPAGSAMRSDMVKALLVIRQGQTVRVISRGPGFEVANDGRAMTNGAEGQIVQIRMGNGQVVSGRATGIGTIEINN